MVRLCGRDLGLFHQSLWLLSRGQAARQHRDGHARLRRSPRARRCAGCAPLHVAVGRRRRAPARPGPVWSSRAPPPSPTSRRLSLGSRAAGVMLGAAFVLAVDMQNAVMFDFNPTTCGAGSCRAWRWAFARGRLRLFLARCSPSPRARRTSCSTPWASLWRSGWRVGARARHDDGGGEHNREATHGRCSGGRSRCALAPESAFACRWPRSPTCSSSSRWARCPRFSSASGFRHGATNSSAHGCGDRRAVMSAPLDALCALLRHARREARRPARAAVRASPS